MFIAEDFIQFKNLFVTQLKKMLSDDELGAFILVLANSQQDEFLKDELQYELKETFAALKNNFSTGSLKTTQDDSDVFKQLLDIDLEDIPVWKYRAAGDWEVSCNIMRQLRPMRVSAQKFASIKQGFDESKFHFNQAFLKPEILWEGLFDDIKLRVLYNKFPFSDYHLLITVSPEKNSSQLLTLDAHITICSLVKNVEKIFPGFGIGFNSLAAGASVNHFHFQGFVRERNFPIENNHWRHNGGEVDYPLTVKCFTDAETSWPYVEQLIDQDIAFNYLYRKSICYIVPRKYQCSVELPTWLSGAGWLDVAGVMTVSDEEVFNAIDGRSITNALALLR